MALPVKRNHHGQKNLAKETSPVTSRGPDARVRCLHKKLAQITAIEEKCEAEGLQPSEDQTEKLGRKAGFEAELHELLNPEPEPSAIPDSWEAQASTEQVPPLPTAAAEPPVEQKTPEAAEQPAEPPVEQKSLEAAVPVRPAEEPAEAPAKVRPWRVAAQPAGEPSDVPAKPRPWKAAAQTAGETSEAPAKPRPWKTAAQLAGELVEASTQPHSEAAAQPAGEQVEASAKAKAKAKAWGKAAAEPTAEFVEAFAKSHPKAAAQIAGEPVEASAKPKAWSKAAAAPADEPVEASAKPHPKAAAQPAGEPVEASAKPKAWSKVAAEPADEPVEASAKAHPKAAAQPASEPVKASGKPKAWADEPVEASSKPHPKAAAPPAGESVEASAKAKASPKAASQPAGEAVPASSKPLPKAAAQPADEPVKVSAKVDNAASQPVGEPAEASAKSQAKAAAASVAGPQEPKTEHVDVDARVKNIRKKLAQIVAIEAKCAAAGMELSEDQLEKVGRKAQFDSEIKQLLQPPANGSENGHALSEQLPAQPAELPLAEVSPKPNTPEAVPPCKQAASVPETEKKSPELAPARLSPKVASVDVAPKPAIVVAPELLPKPDGSETDAVMPRKQEAPAAAIKERGPHMAKARLPRKVATAPVVAAAPVAVAAKPAVVVAPEPSESVQAVAPSVPQVDPRIRTLKKKLAQIVGLEEKVEEGFQLTEEQVEKLERKAEIEEQLAELEGPEVPVEEPAEPEATKSSKKREKEKEKHEKEKEKQKQKQQKPEPLAEDTLKLPVGAKVGSPNLLVLGSPARSGLRSPYINGLRSPMGGLRSPSMRWQDDPLGVEDHVIAPTPKAAEAPKDKEPVVEFIENVQPFAVTTQASERLKAIMAEVSLLSQDAFEEDALHLVTRKSGWKMTLMARPEGYEDASDGMPLDGFCLDGGASASTPMLIGFLIYRLRPELQSFSIAKLAVIPEHRGHGHGRRFIEWCIMNAKKQKTIDYISLSSLPEAIKFYERMGFRTVDVKLEKACADQCGVGEELVEGQVYMEYRIKGRSKGRKKGR